MVKKLMIIDTDCGVDDAEALALAFSRPDFEILAISCVAGNTEIENVTGNVLRVIKMLNHKSISVFRGCGTPLLGTPQRDNKTNTAHGNDGFGGISDSISVDKTQISQEHAVDALVRLVKEHPKQITLVTLGPLTNVAMAKRLWADFSDNLKELFIMGGNHEAKGNTSPCAEFNFWFDVEAAFIVLKEFACPMTLVTWETCIETVLPWDWHHQWLASNNSLKAKFLHRLTKDVVRRRRDKLLPAKRELGFHSCDLLAMAVVADPNIVVEKHRVFASVELWGKLTRGQVVIDWRVGVNDQQTPNITLVTKVDAEKLKPLYMQMVV